MNGGRWKLLLVGSLVLNVFLLGGIAGGAYRLVAARGASVEAQAQQLQQEQQQQHALRFAAENLSAERQEEFIDGLKDARRDGRQFARDAREGRREVLRLLAAPQLDRVALDDALARTRAADSALRAKVESSVADFAASLTPDERAKFAESLKQRGQWREPEPAKPASQPPHQ
ncbi:MAG TPA: periplasmic heavy metal sensor [Paraburkholderia sp.]|nr:periplasmic heavy metal sensor [Paraburkholderia sp.]